MVMMTLTIDGQRVEAMEGSSILEVAREYGIEIPTLCYHEALEPYGSCRLCVVELETPRGPQLVASCVYLAEEGAVVRTGSEMVQRSRRMTAELLLASAPNAKVIQELAAKMGALKPRVSLSDNDCILCGLCVRACKEIVGANAISLVNRGFSKEVSPPFEIGSNACVGCTTCVFICPTGAIKLEDVLAKKSVHHWESDFKARACKICGDHFLAPEFATDLGESVTRE
ncbi:MAG: 2Fe-2S iron-sulfur cluster binding domain-containing protein [Anaerolineae bacterium]|nr:2Fe-2S iron-sulfur cluster binding domain-containing protein [Anaerolineae bacterium]NIQ82779.1 2Fe-2S iron-sulfur cluster binding domain-containing protein [Anaerolineae bacterium]